MPTIPEWLPTTNCILVHAFLETLVQNQLDGRSVRAVGVEVRIADVSRKVSNHRAINLTIRYRELSIALGVC